MSFAEGGFLPNFMETLQYWYDRGIRMYKFCFGRSTKSRLERPARQHEVNVYCRRRSMARCTLRVGMACGFLCLVLACQFVVAQSTTGSIYGQVTDRSGASSAPMSRQ